MTQQRGMVYLDYAAATPLSASVREAMYPYLSDFFANPQSLHAIGRAQRQAVDDARALIAEDLNVSADELVFTTGGTDANTRAFHGVLYALLDSGRALNTMHVVVSAIEHHSVRACAELWSRRGVRVSYIPVTKDGLFDIKEVERLVEKDTVLVSMMLVNNEIGVLEPIRDAVRAVRRKASTWGGTRTPLVHTDASQAPRTLSLDLRDLDVDLATFDAMKLYGPPAVGALFVRNGTPYAGLCGVVHKPDRGGTESVAGIVGFAKAWEHAKENRGSEAAHVEELRAYLVTRITERFPDAHINGAAGPHAGGIVNVSFPGHEGEFLAAQLSERSVAVSSKSACLSGGGEGSHVVAAMDPAYAEGALRFSFGTQTTKDDIDYAIAVLAEIVP